jgi:hypothetical protein
MSEGSLPTTSPIRALLQKSRKKIKQCRRIATRYDGLAPAWQRAFRS